MDPREPRDLREPRDPRERQGEPAGRPQGPRKPGEASGESDIRERIEALRLVLHSRRAQGYAPAAEPVPGGGAAEIEHAREVSGDHGRCLLIERDVGEILGADAPGDERLTEAYRKLLPEAAPGAEPARAAVVYLDLETTGLAATPLFLAGALVHRDGGLRAVQLLARDYSEERCVIDLVDGMLAGCGVCVTFNGKSFDLPYLRERAKYHRLALRPGPEQFDLLHHARRRWKHRLPDCRLLTLEWFILGRRRMGDVDGWEVPCIYHEFVHTKDARRLKQVLRHNLMDVLAMAELMVSLAEA